MSLLLLGFSLLLLFISGIIYKKKAVLFPSFTDTSKVKQILQTVRWFVFSYFLLGLLGILLSFFVTLEIFLFFISFVLLDSAILSVRLSKQIS